MRLLFVVQRYGPEVFGGAESCARAFATRLAARGHDVEVVTTCAVDYRDWADSYPAGRTVADGVVVHRLEVPRPRDNALFDPVNQRVNAGHRPTPLHLQRAWMDLQGPRASGLPAWLDEHAAGYDVAAFFTYLYWTTWAGLPAAAGLVPTVLHPTAHDEPPLYLEIFDLMFRLPRAFGFLSLEEARLVANRFRVRRPSVTTGVGVDLDPTAGDEAAFRDAWGLGGDPYLLFVGRLDPHKGTDELFDFFVTLKRRRPGPLRLVVVGQPVVALPEHPDVVVTGWVDEGTKQAAIEGCLALVQPSYLESFSMALTEAWARSRPALVQARCEVLLGQARRSGGALPYRGFAEFEAAVEWLAAEPALAAALGAAGRRHVELHYGWDSVLGRYERFLESLAA